MLPLKFRESVVLFDMSSKIKEEKNGTLKFCFEKLWNDVTKPVKQCLLDKYTCKVDANRNIDTGLCVKKNYSNHTINICIDGKMLPIDNRNYDPIHVSEYYSTHCFLDILDNFINQRNLTCQFVEQYLYKMNNRNKKTKTVNKLIDENNAKSKTTKIIKNNLQKSGLHVSQLQKDNVNLNVQVEELKKILVSYKHVISETKEKLINQSFEMYLTREGCHAWKQHFSNKSKKLNEKSATTNIKYKVLLNKVTDELNVEKSESKLQKEINQKFINENKFYILFIIFKSNEIEHLKQQLKTFKLELANREDNFNQKFVQKTPIILSRSNSFTKYSNQIPRLSSKCRSRIKLGNTIAIDIDTLK
ncbi:hypothetical protein A3Q56_01969 [Intoshia linei]|uniref:Uncharacterized protein n=1 Tax=Intoshia linei TaxID=1819745 RepID=A0A177BA46_9BILA|nr:hypothetical protein A3Q56_01969 [Intoshia linei]